NAGEGLALSCGASLRAARIAAIIPSTRLRPSSTTKILSDSPFIRHTRQSTNCHGNDREALAGSEMFDLNDWKTPSDFERRLFLKRQPNPELPRKRNANGGTRTEEVSQTARRELELFQAGDRDQTVAGGKARAEVSHVSTGHFGGGNRES